MEALQMIKFYLKKERLNFTDLWMTPDSQMVDDDPEGDLLSDLLQGDVERVLDDIIQSINADEA